MLWNTISINMILLLSLMQMLLKRNWRKQYCSRLLTPRALWYLTYVQKWHSVCLNNIDRSELAMTYFLNGRDVFSNLSCPSTSCAKHQLWLYLAMVDRTLLVSMTLFLSSTSSASGTNKRVVIPWSNLMFCVSTTEESERCHSWNGGDDSYMRRCGWRLKKHGRPDHQKDSVPNLWTEELSWTHWYSSL